MDYKINFDENINLGYKKVNFRIPYINCIFLYKQVDIIFMDLRLHQQILPFYNFSHDLLLIDVL